MVRSRSRNKSTRAPAMTIRHLQKAIHRSNYGTQITPSPDPPDYSRAPWNSVTLVHDQGSVGSANLSKTFSYPDLRDGLFAKNGWSSIRDNASTPAVVAHPWEFRIQSVRVWGLDKQFINLNIYEMVDSTHRVKQLSDVGSGINYSRLGWRYGVASQINPGREGSTSQQPLFTVEGPGRILVYVQVLYAVASAPASGSSQLASPPNPQTWFGMITS